mgnify:CR=1 FL=1
MSGILNQIGSVSGILGTTEGAGGLQTLYRQNVHGATDTLSLGAGATVNSSVYTMDIVSKADKSQFLVSLYLGFPSSTTTDSEINFNETIGGTTTILPYRATSGDVGYGGGSSRIDTYYPRLTQVMSAPAQSSGTTITFSVQFINHHTSATWTPYYNGSHVIMTAMEIAP